MGEPRNVGHLVIINEDAVWFLLVLCAKPFLIPAPLLGLETIGPGHGSPYGIYIQCLGEETVRISAATWPTGIPPG